MGRYTICSPNERRAKHPVTCMHERACTPAPVLLHAPGRLRASPSPTRSRYTYALARTFARICNLATVPVLLRLHPCNCMHAR
eukprot:1373918-Pleurochrysis_carterae.AAC.1